MTIRLSRLARRDLEDIRRYTPGTWGREQWAKYYQRLVRAFEGIMANPDRGRDRSLFAAGMRSVNYGGARHLFAAQAIEPTTRVHPVGWFHQHHNMPALVYCEDLDA